MAEARDREPAEKVEIAVPVGIVEIRSVPARERDRKASVDVNQMPMRGFDDF
jgi:hypothetical protein